ncbi:MAG: prepilin-type N-terminal cleavage/methylation domain-containing protein [Gammaproteobacteria bacterium]|nr:prepilin-type N-terminal cleavage/methylation domain-containing protein [Gammaproteobacteria bacterium]
MYKASNNQGLSLLEVLITLAIIGIVVAWALPNYQQTVLNSHRKDMQGEMLELAAAQEQERTLNGSYAAVASFTSDSGRYDVVITLPAGQNYLITASAKSAQASDTGCTTLTLDGIGNRSPHSCWVK